MSEVITLASNEDHVVEVEVSNVNGHRAWWEDGGSKIMLMKVVYRSTPSSPPWGSFTATGTQNNVQNWQFVDAATDVATDHGTAPLHPECWWTLCVVDVTDSEPVKFFWQDIEFSVVVAYWHDDDVSNPAFQDFKRLLAPPTLIYLVDASGSMANHMHDIVNGQLETIVATVQSLRWNSAMVLKHGGVRAFPDAWNAASPPAPAVVMDDVKAYLGTGAGNSPIGALVAKAQSTLEAGQFMSPEHLTNGMLALVTDGKENGGQTPTFALTDTDDLANHPIRAWLRRYGYTLRVFYHEALPDEIWGPWMDTGTIMAVDIDGP